MEGSFSVMHPESLVQLVDSGNHRKVEEEWMKLVESSDVGLDAWVRYDVVMAAMCKRGAGELAETLAWAAIEAIASRCAPLETLTVAGPFLRAVSRSPTLRGQVVDLYRSAYEGREGLEALLEEAGLAGGRPVRRALRTLEVCLPLNEGDCLVGRDEATAARVDRIDRTTWEFVLQQGRSSRTVGAVPLADEFEPAAADDFRVQRQFGRDQLEKRLHGDPASIVVDFCKTYGHKTDSHQLELGLVPALLSQSDWKKWWTKARTALKRNPNIVLEGRSPYTITYVDSRIDLGAMCRAEFDKRRDVLDRLALLEKYVRECKSRQETVSEEMAHYAYNDFHKRATRLTQQRSPLAGLLWCITMRVKELTNLGETMEDARSFFAELKDFRSVCRRIPSPVLIDHACDLLVEARPENWQEELLAILPIVPLAACDQIASRLVKAGRNASDFELVVQQILSSPLDHFEALLWLWDGPSMASLLPVVPAVTVLMTILRALNESRRGDRLGKGVAKQMAVRARAVLPARKMERFASLLEEIESGMAEAIKTRMSRCEGLGRAVREDMLRRLTDAFPSSVSQPDQALWEKDDTLYVTKAGLSRKHDEIEHHVNVKMRDNARAIGAAAERGDLSENSEYKFALEERDLLRSRLAQMNDEVAKAKVVTREDVPTDHIGIGTRVVFRHVENGTLYEMTFLGPWEADPSRSRFNYQAPLSQGLMGKGVGDKVEFSHTGASGVYEILSLHNALAEDDSPFDRNDSAADTSEALVGRKDVASLAPPDGGVG